MSKVGFSSLKNNHILTVAKGSSTNADVSRNTVPVRDSRPSKHNPQRSTSPPSKAAAGNKFSAASTRCTVAAAGHANANNPAAAKPFANGPASAIIN